MGPREPEEEIPQEEISEVENIGSAGGEQQGEEEVKEREQTPEEVLAAINEAIENGKEVLLTQAGSDGKSFITNVAIPHSIEGNFLTIEADGYGLDIEISSIKRAELAKKETEE